MRSSCSAASPARRRRRTGAASPSEYRRAWSRRIFVASLRELVPAIGEEDVRRAGCGVRAQAVDRLGRLLDDFAFAEGERQLHVLNAPSPGATASASRRTWPSGPLVIDQPLASVRSG